MTDVAITWDKDAMEGVISFDKSINDLVADKGLSTAVLISLFTDARAKDDDILPDVLTTDNFPDRRGWWADETSERQSDSVGSRLWLLSRAKSTIENLRSAEKYAKEALQWMVDEGIAVKINCMAEALDSPGGGGMKILLLTVQIHKAFGEQIVYKYELLWEETIRCL